MGGIDYPVKHKLAHDRLKIVPRRGTSENVRHRNVQSEKVGAQAIGTLAVGAKAIGNLAVGAIAIGALAIGALAIGRLVIGRARVRRLEIDELVVRKLRITEELQVPKASAAEANEAAPAHQTVRRISRHRIVPGPRAEEPRD